MKREREKAVPKNDAICFGEVLREELKEIEQLRIKRRVNGEASSRANNGATVAKTNSEPDQNHSKCVAVAEEAIGNAHKMELVGLAF